ITVLDREHQKQQTVALLSISVALPHDFKGTHMSRFIEVLNDHRGEITMRTLPAILKDIKMRLSAESAHIEVTFPYFLERTASAPVYPLLKRADERHVTMQAYDKPMFVEDVVRDVARSLQSDLRVAWFRVLAKNEESIHNHSAFAQIEWARLVSQPLPELAVAEAVS